MNYLSTLSTSLSRQKGENTPKQHTGQISLPKTQDNSSKLDETTSSIYKISNNRDLKLSQANKANSVEINIPTTSFSYSVDKPPCIHNLADESQAFRQRSWSPEKTPKQNCFHKTSQQKEVRNTYKGRHPRFHSSEIKRIISETMSSNLNVRKKHTTKPLLSDKIKSSRFSYGSQELNYKFRYRKPTNFNLSWTINQKGILPSPPLHHLLRCPSQENLALHLNLMNPRLPIQSQRVVNPTIIPVSSKRRHCRCPSSVFHQQGLLPSPPLHVLPRFPSQNSLRRHLQVRAAICPSCRCNRNLTDLVNKPCIGNRSQKQQTVYSSAGNQSAVGNKKQKRTVFTSPPQKIYNSKQPCISNPFPTDNSTRFPHHVSENSSSCNTQLTYRQKRLIDKVGNRHRPSPPKSSIQISDFSLSISKRKPQTILPIIPHRFLPKSNEISCSHHRISHLSDEGSLQLWKAKPKKHTAKELFLAKLEAATTNRGGGKAGLVDRTGKEKGGHTKLEYPLCKVTDPDIKTMQIHHDAKHPKIPFDEAKLNNLDLICYCSNNFGDTQILKPNSSIQWNLFKTRNKMDNGLQAPFSSRSYARPGQFVLKNHKWKKTHEEALGENKRKRKRPIDQEESKEEAGGHDKKVKTALDYRSRPNELSVEFLQEEMVILDQNLHRSGLE